MTPMTHILPTAEEVEPWVEAIVRLWDDPAFYEEQSVKARAEAQRWHPDRLRPLYAEFFSSVRPQTRPPILSKMSGGVDPTQRVSGGRNGSAKRPCVIRDEPRLRRGTECHSVLQQNAPAVGVGSSQDHATPLSRTQSLQGPSGVAEPVVSRSGLLAFSFVVCVSDEAVLNANLMASPCVAGRLASPDHCPSRGAKRRDRVEFRAGTGEP